VIRRVIVFKGEITNVSVIELVTEDRLNEVIRLLEQIIKNRALTYAFAQSGTIVNIEKSIADYIAGIVEGIEIAKIMVKSEPPFNKIE
jgi:hypothetical protein